LAGFCTKETELNHGSLENGDFSGITAKYQQKSDFAQSF
jgi:hypothetical protein